MTFDEYQQAAHATAIYPKDREREYLSLGLISEVGELAGKLKKEIRDGVDLTEAIIDEASDCCWYASQMAGTWGHKVSFSKMAYAMSDIDAVFELASVASVKHIHPAMMSSVFAILNRLCANRGATIESVCEHNIAKLQSRQQRNALGGSGDNR